jgi:hypothetical protein
MTKAKYPTQGELLDAFELKIDFRNGDETLWRRNNRGNNKWLKVECKANTDKGYCQVAFKERTVRYHAIVYILVNGNIPEGYNIDHIDCERINNHSSNLQITTQREQNQGKAIHRIDGKLVGTSKRGNRFEASIKVKGNTISLGRYDTKEEASNAYFKAVELLNEGKTINETQNFFNIKPYNNNLMKGATFNKALGKWRARLTTNYKQVHLGLFSTQEEAYEAILKYKSGLLERKAYAE